MLMPELDNLGDQKYQGETVGGPHVEGITPL